MSNHTKTRKDAHGRTEVWVKAGELGYVLAGRVIRNHGQWAACPPHAEPVTWCATLSEAVEVLS